MKRELKRQYPATRKATAWYCKAYPDEKGIETHVDARPIALNPDCKAYPDEKGIETYMLGDDGEFHKINCKAYPDEKGIETWSR